MVSPPVSSMVLLGLIACERMAELAVSARHARVLRSLGAVEVGRRHFPWMVALHASFLPACLAEIVFLQRIPPPLVSALALAGVALAIGLRWWAVSSLGIRWTVGILVLPDTLPLRRGPYRFLRHPNYLAVALEMLSVPLAVGAWFCAAAYTLADAAMLAVRIRAEERALGQPWQREFAGVPRLLPRLSR